MTTDPREQLCTCGGLDIDPDTGACVDCGHEAAEHDMAGRCEVDMRAAGFPQSVIDSRKELAMTSQPTPVRISFHVEGFGGNQTEEIEIARDRWDAMTPRERADMLDQDAEDFATNYVAYGWHIDDPADLAATEAP